jgi:hypothetical protein
MHSFLLLQKKRLPLSMKLLTYFCAQLPSERPLNSGLLIDSNASEILMNEDTVSFAFCRISHYSLFRRWHLLELRAVITQLWLFNTLAYTAGCETG